MRHRVCDHRPHRLIRVWVSAAALLVVAGMSVRLGVAVGSADLTGRVADRAVVACTAPVDPPAPVRTAARQ